MSTCEFGDFVAMMKEFCGMKRALHAHESGAAHTNTPDMRRSCAGAVVPVDLALVRDLHVDLDLAAVAAEATELSVVVLHLARICLLVLQR
jgi:hypothetical protein